ncbi:MAG: hypothetical protein ACD_79C01458G0001, partial [uncultured bacterium]
MSAYGAPDSVGLVKTQSIDIKEKIELDSKEKFGPITVGYETYGSLNENKTNGILITHALS